MKSRVIAAMAIVPIVLLLSACPNQTVRDLEGIPVKDPDKLELYVNVDKYPNAVVMCIHGEGFITTTRDNSNAALQHVPEWGQEGGWCK